MSAMETENSIKPFKMLVFCCIAGLALSFIYLFKFANKSIVFCILITLITALVFGICFIGYWSFKNYKKQKSVRIVVQSLSLLAIGMGLLQNIDFFLPNQVMHFEVVRKYIDRGEYVVQFGDFHIAVKQHVYDAIGYGDQVLLEYTPIFHESNRIFIKGTNHKFSNVTPNGTHMKLFGLFLIGLPALLFIFRKEDGGIYIILLMVNFIFGLIASALWIKLFAVVF